MKASTSGRFPLHLRPPVSHSEVRGRYCLCYRLIQGTESDTCLRSLNAGKVTVVPKQLSLPVKESLKISILKVTMPSTPSNLALWVPSLISKFLQGGHSVGDQNFPTVLSLLGLKCLITAYINISTFHGRPLLFGEAWL